MTTKAKKAEKPDTEKIAAVVYRLNTLLHTMRAIERHEEQLCGIMTEIRLSGGVTASLDEELRDLLEQMPAHEYLEDIDAVRQALGPEILVADPAGIPATPAKKSAPKKTARPKAGGRAAR